MNILELLKDKDRLVYIEGIKTMIIYDQKHGWTVAPSMRLLERDCFYSGPSGEEAVDAFVKNEER